MSKSKHEGKTFKLKSSVLDQSVTVNEALTI